MRAVRTAVNKKAAELSRASFERYRVELAEFVAEERMRGRTSDEIIAGLAVYQPVNQGLPAQP